MFNDKISKNLQINPMDLTGKRVLVTGGSSGIGLGVAELLSKLGARLVLVGRNLARLELAMNRLEGCGHAIEVYDLLNSEGIAMWVKDLATRGGRIDGVVHSAGVFSTKPLRIMGASDWDLSMRINVTAGAALVKGFRQPGVNNEGGSVVFISSVMGLTGKPGQILYSATKGALISMTRSMALELAKDAIRVNCVAPAVISTGMSENLEKRLTSEQFDAIVKEHPLGLGTAEDVANAVAFLVARTSRWITGTTLVVDGGYTAQ